MRNLLHGDVTAAAMRGKSLPLASRLLTAASPGTKSLDTGNQGTLAVTGGGVSPSSFTLKLAMADNERPGNEPTVSAWQRWVCLPFGVFNGPAIFSGQAAGVAPRGASTSPHPERNGHESAEQPKAASCGNDDYVIVGPLPAAADTVEGEGAAGASDDGRAPAGQVVAHAADISPPGNPSEESGPAPSAGNTPTDQVNDAVQAVQAEQAEQAVQAEAPSPENNRAIRGARSGEQLGRTPMGFHPHPRPRPWKERRRQQHCRGHQKQ
ncbi:hypothetical protein VOLCADRAFT_92609 [Volvox carteri f. nagariensis]|uniref:Uncharacterized protein n=1 Tax=Volvox carteri f. nagariensis TaxID=3068 RepID=D8U034_VOLCA|nr:uncharacterized protein VOLCADRAFT_92609 [Volvox carteri f. nagariensis]EFJ46868.1 hypothetical protein VOLCADRAFT_92609 [Volvox carteri f. nagariensis]|eukprot:XP_002952077.1 hypothetical protein VOLCADRAFT_92609 [Volvox carteri f. nagariensis]